MAMKKLIAATTLAVTALSLAACGDDSEDNGNPLLTNETTDEETTDEETDDGETGEVTDEKFNEGV